MKRELLFVIIVSAVLTSCGSILDGLSSMYGGGYGGGYNPYAGFWNSPAATTSVPSALNPTVAAEAAAKQGMNNITSGFWDNVAKEEKQRQNMVDAVAKDVWAHPEKYQGTPVGGSSSEGGSASGTVSSSRSTSGSNGHQCRLCKGTGRKIRELHPANVNQTKWCSECKKNVHTGHSHTRCDLCGGDGWID